MEISSVEDSFEEGSRSFGSCEIVVDSCETEKEGSVEVDADSCEGGADEDSCD